MPGMNMFERTYLSRQFGTWKLNVNGFGKFEVSKKQARRGRDPQTGGEITIDPRTIITFRPSSILRGWANYSSTCKKAKAHIEFDINRGIPKKLTLTDGNAVERQFVEVMIGPDETAVFDVDRGDFPYLAVVVGESYHIAV